MLLVLLLQHLWLYSFSILVFSSFDSSSIDLSIIIKHPKSNDGFLCYSVPLGSVFDTVTHRFQMDFNLEFQYVDIVMDNERVFQSEDVRFVHSYHQ